MEVEEPALHVAVHTLGGKRLEFDVEVGPQTRVQNLKFEIMDHWKVPPLLQVLVCGDKVLDRNMSLAQLVLQGSASLSLTLVLAMDEAYKALDDSDPWLRGMAAGALTQMVAPGDNRLSSSMARCLRDRDFDVRRTATRHLAALAKLGDEGSAGALLACARHFCPTVRCAALSVQALRAAGGDWAAVDKLAAGLHDKDIMVRWAAVEGLEQAARRCDADGAFQAVLRELGGNVPKWTSQSALQALHRLAPLASRGCRTSALDGVLLHLTDDDWLVRHAAAEALGPLAASGDVRAVASLKERLDDAEACVRRAALSSLGMLISGRPEPEVTCAITQVPSTPVRSPERVPEPPSPPPATPCKRARLGAERGLRGSPLPPPLPLGGGSK